MAHAQYLVKFEGSLYANVELFARAVVGSWTAFVKALHKKVFRGMDLLDQVLYPVPPEREVNCRGFLPTYQDFDDAVLHFNILSKDTLREIREGGSDAFPGATVIQIRREMFPEVFKYRRFTFFRVRDYDEKRKYNMLPKMAAVRLCGFLYVALDATDVRVEAPIITTLRD